MIKSVGNVNLENVKTLFAFILKSKYRFFINLNKLLVILYSCDYIYVIHRYLNN